MFADLANLQPANFLIPYTVNSPLWSDGAVKQRWMALPENSKIHFAAKGEWTFPAGTVFVKNFALPVDDTNPKILRRLETRLLVRDTNGDGLWRELQMARGQFATPILSPPAPTKTSPSRPPPARACKTGFFPAGRIA